LESTLFEEDAGRHDPYSDTTWPAREGMRDFRDLMNSPESIVLVARTAGDIVGFLAGYTSHPTPTRQLVNYAILRSMYVKGSARRLGAAKGLTEHFTAWARGRSCVEVHVSHYAANDAARELYEELGFAERSVTRVLAL